MRSRIVAGVSIGVVLVACVDLFHSTDFETLRDAGATDDGATTDAPADGAKPPVDFCTWTPTQAKASATRACAWLGACGGPLDATAFGPCMVQALWAYDCSLNPVMRPNGTTRTLWACLSDVKSCADVDTCLHGGATPPTCRPVAGGSFSVCAPDSGSEVRVECASIAGGAPTGTEPCALSGRSCVTIDESRSICGGATRASCSEGFTCSGTAAVDCRFQGALLVDKGVDCAAFGGGTCVLDFAGVACAPQADAGACEGGLDVACTGDGGNVATSCVGGREIAIDCTKLGVRCDVGAGVPTYAPLAACFERVDAGRCNVADTCNDGKLRSCAQGIAFEADCASLGLRACEVVGSSAVARCVRP